MADILYPTKTRRFMSEVAGVRRYHRDPARASAAPRDGVLSIAVSRGWNCNPNRVAKFIASASAGGKGRASWFDSHRLLEPISYILPAEAEANFYRQLTSEVISVAA